MFYLFFCSYAMHAKTFAWIMDMEDIYKQNNFATDPVVFIFQSAAPAVACTIYICNRLVLYALNSFHLTHCVESTAIK